MSDDGKLGEEAGNFLCEELHYSIGNWDKEAGLTFRDVVRMMVKFYQYRRQFK